MTFSLFIDVYLPPLKQDVTQGHFFKAELKQVWIQIFDFIYSLLEED